MVVFVLIAGSSSTYKKIQMVYILYMENHEGMNIKKQIIEIKMQIFFLNKMLAYQSKLAVRLSVNFER